MVKQLFRSKAAIDIFLKRIPDELKELCIQSEELELLLELAVEKMVGDISNYGASAKSTASGAPVRTYTTFHQNYGFHQQNFICLWFSIPQRYHNQYARPEFWTWCRPINETFWMRIKCVTVLYARTITRLPLVEHFD